MSNNKLYFLAFGGLREIGCNSSLFAFGPQIQSADLMMVDLGLSFPGPSAPGVNVVFPDIQWLHSMKQKLKGICITHGHEDHIGALPHFWPKLNCPIYCSKFTAAIIKAKFKQHDINTNKIKIVTMDKEVVIGAFRIKFIEIAHSIPGSCMLLIQAGSKKILYTGDWKYDQNPIIGKAFTAQDLKSNIPQNLDVVFCDSTNVFEDRSVKSEKIVQQNLIKYVKSHKQGRVILTCFASNVARISMAVEIASMTGRKLVIVGRSFQNFYRLAMETKLINQGSAYFLKDLPKIPPTESLVLCTGSQGETGSNLIRLAKNQLSALSLTDKDLVIFSSRIIPGNEIAVRNIQNTFLSRGVKIITCDDYITHVSGHPCVHDLQTFYEHVQPQAVIPIHGEIRHLKKHADLIKKWGIKKVMVASDGDLVDLDNWRIEKSIKTQVMALDGELMVPIDSGYIKARLQMQQGLISVLLIQNHKGYVCDIKVHTHGLTNNFWINDTIQKDIDDYLGKSTWGNDIDFAKIRKLIKMTVNSFLNLDPFIIINIYSL